RGRPCVLDGAAGEEDERALTVERRHLPRRQAPELEAVGHRRDHGCREKLRVDSLPRKPPPSAAASFPGLRSPAGSLRRLASSSGPVEVPCPSSITYVCGLATVIPFAS